MLKYSGLMIEYLILPFSRKNEHHVSHCRFTSCCQGCILNKWGNLHNGPGWQHLCCQSTRSYKYRVNYFQSCIKENKHNNEICAYINILHTTSSKCLPFKKQCIKHFTGKPPWTGGIIYSLRKGNQSSENSVKSDLLMATLLANFWGGLEPATYSKL